MSHVVVGERLAGMNPEIVGHIVAGAGHLIENGNGLVQEFSRNLNQIPYVVARSLPDLTDPATWDRWQWNALASNYGQGSMLAGNNESSAWDRYMEHPSTQNNLEVMKEVALAVGSAAAGDLGGAINHGVDAVDKSIDGFLKDMGFNGGWGDWGPTPGMGTCPPTGDR